MRKLIRIMAGIAIVGALAFVAPPANADHWVAPNPTPGDPHESAPNPAFAGFESVCAVAGEVLPGVTGGTSHTVNGNAVPGTQATHSHYKFVETSIVCDDILGGLGVTANGGNDGHLVDVECTTGDLNPSDCNTLVADVPHDHNAHHGSTNESGWSHCSDYNGDIESGGTDADDCTYPEAESNDCVSADNRNKGDIAAGAATGWVKYLRVGVVIYAWGCFDTPATVANLAARPFFSAALAIFPPSTAGAGNLPLCLVPDNPVTGTPPSCGFSIAGVAHRSAAWLTDLA